VPLHVPHCVQFCGSNRARIVQQQAAHAVHVATAALSKKTCSAFMGRCALFLGMVLVKIYY
jgi:hypothetical protein